MDRHWDFRLEKEALVSFLENYISVETDASGETTTSTKYMRMLQEIANRKRTALEVELDDLETFAPGGDLVEHIERNTAQYLALIAEAADAKMPEPTDPDLVEDVFDVLLDQRRRAQEMTRAQMEVEGRPDQNDPRFALPPSLMRRYEVVVRPRAKAPVSKLRDIAAHCIGALEVTGKTFNPLAEAPEEVKALNGGKSELFMQARPDAACGRSRERATRWWQARRRRKRERLSLVPLSQVRGSKFVRYQEAKVQESPDEVPQGSTPRTMVVHLRGSLTRVVKAGDSVTLSGIFLPEPFVGQRAIARASLLTATYVEAMAVRQNKTSYAEMSLSEEQRAAIEAMTEEGDIYGRLASSIAPEIYGHEDVKKALLLAMVGGVDKTTADGMKLRGSIHACLMGDPGVAKSQLLRYVAHISPRAVYTTGKGSSGVGLTAAVVKDPTTSELVLEGGALVMADKGICCIDEFDKMEEADRTAIHEVMEQQTVGAAGEGRGVRGSAVDSGCPRHQVSIAKAGITTTLNTRTTLLAAANPAFGRYDVRRSPAENINLPAALLSRFDVLWLILDRPSVEQDLSLAQHVLAVHREGRAPAPASGGAAPLSPDLLRAYIAAAKQHQPYVPAALTDYVAAVYAEMRAEEAATDAPHTYTTARTLLSILRLSQALARLRFADHVEQARGRAVAAERGRHCAHGPSARLCRPQPTTTTTHTHTPQFDVDEALRLMKMSKASLYEEAGGERAADPISQIFSRIRQHAERTRRAAYTWAELLDFLGTSFRPEQIKQCLADYASINVWQLEGADTEAPSITLAAA
eukprot:scaffold20.g7647.t1